MKTLKGSEITPQIERIAKFRLSIFKDYPYLYQGSLENEIDYVSAYALSVQSIFVYLEDESGLRAASLGMPLKQKSSSFTAPLANDNIDSIFYIGEIMVRQDARQRGLGRELMHKMISQVDMQTFNTLSLYTVERADNHPLKPLGYSPPDHLWKMFGFEKLENRTAFFKWQEPNEQDITEKNMSIWMKTAKAQ